MSNPRTVRLGTAMSAGLLVVLALALMPGTAQAWTANHFYSPTRNIECNS